MKREAHGDERDLFYSLPDREDSSQANNVVLDDRFPALRDIPKAWRPVLTSELGHPCINELRDFLVDEFATHTIFPPRETAFNALALTTFESMKVLLLGQDPYHGPGQAHGLCFSVRPGVRKPPSLVNMFRELRDDLGHDIPSHGCLNAWASQGVLLLNAVLTVRAGEANSHKDRGWEQLTDSIIRLASERHTPMVFVLWGAYAQKKEKLIDTSRHIVLKSAHPSPLSAKKFFGCRPYSAINNALRRLGQSPIDWRLPESIET